MKAMRRFQTICPEFVNRAVSDLLIKMSPGHRSRPQKTRRLSTTHEPKWQRNVVCVVCVVGGGVVVCVVCVVQMIQSNAVSAQGHANVAAN